MPPTTESYLFTELELFGLVINKALSKHLLAEMDSDCTANHVAVAHIMKLNQKLQPLEQIGYLRVLTDYTFYL